MTENRQARTLQNSENFVLSQNGVRKYFFGKIICSIDQKKHFFNIWGSFWKIEFLTENRQARTLQNSENFVLSKWGKKIIFGKIICSTHQKKHFYNIWGSFWKIEFLTENWQARTLQNSENFVLSQNGVRKYFLAKLFVRLIKRTFLQHLRHFLENWTFD